MLDSIIMTITQTQTTEMDNMPHKTPPPHRHATTRLLLLLITALVTLSASSHPADALHVYGIPLISGDRVPLRLLSTRNRRVQHRLVVLHNHFRTQVRPSAANMLHMRWHQGAARNAQRWADQCQFLQHSDAEARAVHRFPQCGQNVFVSPQKVPWLFVLRSWFVEHQNFTYGSPHNQPALVGHYTQMVWASTHRVGCAVSKCAHGGPRGKPFYNYVCDYCPIGNYPQTLATPYKAGAPCSACRSKCKSNKLRLCTNACPVADNFSNCRDLYKSNPDWLCGTKNGRSRNTIFSGDGYREQCLASCTCHGKIFH